MKTVIEINTLDDAIDFTRVKRVLVIKLQHLGDVLLTTPLFGVLMQQYPHLEIDALIYQETTQILEANPDIKRVYAIDRSWKKKGVLFQLQKELSLLRNLRSNRYDLIINLTDRWRGGWLTRILQPSYSVSQPFSHRRGKFWRKSFTHLYSTPKLNRHTVEANLDAVRRLGVRPKPEQKSLKFVVDQALEDLMRHRLKVDGLESKQIAVIHPTSRWMFKAWNYDGFARVIEELHQKGWGVVLISGPATEEVAYVSAILELTEAQVINLAGQLSLSQSAAMIKIADVFIGLDSVAMHIAAAVDTPCVALFGPTKNTVWRPWMNNHEIVSEDYACRPCGLKGCGDGMMSECIQAIQPNRVLSAIENVMQIKRAAAPE